LVFWDDGLFESRPEVCGSVVVVSGDGNRRCSNWVAAIPVVVAQQINVEPN
jgi:hypothetical protein